LSAHADSQPLSTRTDAWLVEQSRALGNQDAFGELVRRYQDRVFRLVVSILGQEFAADAEDAAQEVFVRAHQALRTYRGDAAFGTWLYRITFNHAVNVKGRMRFRAPHVPDAALVSYPAGTVAPDEQFEARRRQTVLLACLNELPDVYQSAVRLHYWLGASMSDIAAMLEIPENTVKSYLHRARRLLRAMLAQRGLDG
jgi:RNA polymerase sigma-70 factor (ECF subfamily)